MLYLPPLEINDLKDLVIKKISNADLNRESFDYMSDDYDFIQKLLKNSLDNGVSGVNILLYGLPGTGKTELVKSLSHEIKSNLYSISEYSNELNPDERIVESIIAKSILISQINSILLFDEAEDIFSKHESNYYNKVFINRMLETNSIPVIWITNSIEKIDPSHLRRFTYALEVKTPPPEARERIWVKLLKNNRIKIKEEEVAKISREYDLPPSYAASAVKVARMISDSSAITRTLDSLLVVKNHNNKPQAPQLEKHPFLFSLLNVDIDMEKLVHKIVGKGLTKFSLCLFGPPGTGKSEFVRYLAEMLGR
jgi:SpoVK/Ycf46/Vps4 family AAA+-type ATPase